MYKVLYVSYVRHGGGDWVHTREFLAALGQVHGHVIAHLPRITENPKATSRLEGPAGDPLREIRYFAGLFLTRVREQLSLLKEVKPDLVIFRACRYASLIFLCRRLGIPIVLEVNAPMLERKYLAEQERFRGLPFWCRLEAKVFSTADHLLVVSDVLKDYYTGYGLAADRITTVANGVDIARFHPGVDGTTIRRKLGLEHKLVIGFSGSFTPWHGFDFLAEALGELVRIRPELSGRLALLLVGDARDKVRKIKNSGLSIAITGQVPYEEMPAYLAAMDVIAAPYPPIEPFYFSPLKIVEAMAMGRPVIASSQGQIRRLIQDRITGILYRPGDGEDFNRNLTTLIENPEMRRVMSAKARDRIVAGFTWRHNAERILGICNHLIKKRQQRK